MPMPRLLPLVAIAAAGVLAINAVENGPGIVGAARSFAEGVSAKHTSKDAGAKPASALPADASAAGVDANAQVVAAKPAPICAESPTQLAKDAGLSPAELQVIQSLGARRGELDQREQGLDTQLALIQAAEAKVDARIATMNALKGDMQGMLGQLDDKQQAEVDRLVKVFETMINNKPSDAADRFVLLSDEVRLPIAAKMKERLLSAMMAKMPPPEAKRLTESLAARYVAQANAARAALNPPPAPAAKAAKAPPTAAAPAPTQTASAAPAPDATTPAAAKPAKPAIHRKPKPKPAALAANKPAATASTPAKPAATGAAAPGPTKSASTPPATPTKSASAAPTPPKPAAVSTSAAPAPTKAAASTPSTPAPAKTG
jgi:flagellar motility protein MotE (MotC chaperone)